jgi:hypothetical protein
VDTLTFITEMTKALAWPVIAGAGLLLARKPLIVLLDGRRLQRLKGAGWEFEFGELEAKVQRVVADLPAPKPALVMPQRQVEHTDDEAALAAIVTNWSELENIVSDAAGQAIGAHTDGIPFGKLLNKLVQMEVIRPATADGLRGLEALRNLAVHAPQDEALAPRVPHFTAMAQAMRWNLERDLQLAAKRRAAP